MGVFYSEIGQTLLQKHERFALDAQTIHAELEKKVHPPACYHVKGEIPLRLMLAV